MKIIFFCPQFAPVIGGAERQAQRQAAELRRQGFSVEVWTPRVDPASPDKEFIDGVPVNRFALWMWPRHSFFLRAFSFLNGPWLLLQIVCRMWRPISEAAVVHCHLFGLLTLGAAFAARLQRRPIVCKAAIAAPGSDIGEMQRTSFFNRLASIIGPSIFDFWIATTEAVATQLRAAGVKPERLVRIPNGITIDDGPREIRHVRRFLYVGRLSSNINRDTDTLIRAFDEVRREYPEAELILVGGGNLLEHTRQIASQMRYHQQIRVLGCADPRPWLDWADCFVLPSRQEGLSNALLEAMERGLVCVANDIPPNREVLDHGRAGILVPLEDQTYLAAVMKALINDDLDPASFSFLGRERVCAEYNIAGVARKVRDLYSLLVAADTKA